MDSPILGIERVRSPDVGGSAPFRTQWRRGDRVLRFGYIFGDVIGLNVIAAGADWRGLCKPE